MALTLLFRLCLGLVSLAGIGSAIGVPLSLSARGRKVQATHQSIGGGTMQVSVTQCSDSQKAGSAEVLFGSEQSGNLCGTIDRDSSEIKDSAEYSTFIQAQWVDKEQNGKNSANQGKGTPQCMYGGTQSQGAVFDSNNGTQYLGLCNESQLGETKFVKKTKEGQANENKDKGTLGICDKDCGTTVSGLVSGSAITFEEKNLKNENGKQLKFYKRGLA